MDGGTVLAIIQLSWGLRWKGCHTEQSSSESATLEADVPGEDPISPARFPITGSGYRFSSSCRDLSFLSSTWSLETISRAVAWRLAHSRYMVCVHWTTWLHCLSSGRDPLFFFFNKCSANFFYFNIYLFLAVPGLSCIMQTLSCGLRAS